MENSEDAKATLKFAIFSAIVENWPIQNAEQLRDEVYKRILEPHLVWAVRELSKESK